MFVLYPMKAPTRRDERRHHVVEMLRDAYATELSLTSFEQADVPQFLEGTGALVLDRVSRLAYMVRSQRASEIVAERLMRRLGFELVAFSASGTWWRH